MDKSKSFLVVHYDEKTGTHILSVTVVYPAQEGSDLHKELRYSFGKNDIITETKGLYSSPTTDFGYGIDEGRAFSRRAVSWQHFTQITNPFTKQADAYHRLPIFTVKPLPKPQTFAIHSWEQVVHMDKASWAALETQYASTGNLSIAFSKMVMEYAYNSDEVNGISIVFNKYYTSNEEKIIYQFFDDEFNKQGLYELHFFTSDSRKMKILCVPADDSSNPKRAEDIANRFEKKLLTIVKQFNNEIPADQVNAIAKKLNIDLHSLSPANILPTPAKKRSAGIY